MITFRAMKPAEFPNYRTYFVADYAAELATNYGYSPDKSRAIALQELAEDLPQTVATPDHTLLCIEENEDTIGYLWYKRVAHSESVFILDFVIFDAFRGIGQGKAALAALEEQLAQSGVAEIKLRVAFDNERAFNLYKKLGFVVTGYNMIKLLGQ